MKKSKQSIPNWPDHPAAQAGIVNSNAGSLMNDCLNWKYNRSASDDKQIESMKESALKTAVAAIRFLENL